MRIQKHPSLPLWLREDGAVCLPPCPRYPKFRWTYGYKNNHGYLCIKFRGKKYQVHRLICEAFHGPAPVDRPTCDHYPDRNPQNNRADNLRWADMHMQNSNKQICEDCLARYGVQKCKDPRGYARAYYANNPEFAERHRTLVREWQDRQRALGKRQRKCPDGKRRFLTDEEYNERYGKS